MDRMLTAFYAKTLSICLIVALIAISTAASPAEAMFLPAAPGEQNSPSIGRNADIMTIQKMLESRIIRQRLLDYGLNSEKALEKIKSLSNEQVHQLAANINAVQAGGQMRGGRMHGHVGGYGYVYGPLELTLIILLIVLLIMVVAQDDTTTRVG